MRISLRQAADIFKALGSLIEIELESEAALKVAILYDDLKNQVTAAEKGLQARAAEQGANNTDNQDLVREFNRSAEEFVETTFINIPDVGLKITDIGFRQIKPAVFVGVSCLFGAQPSQPINEKGASWNTD
jgi:hypothetical protein